MAKNSIYVAHKNFLTVQNNLQRPDPNIRQEKAREVGEIWDVISQTIETKNTNGSKCSL